MFMKRFLLILLISIVYLNNYIEAKTNNPRENYAYLRGVEAYNDNRLQDAYDWFNKEVSDNPNNGYAFAYLANIYYSNEEYGKSLTAINSAIKNLPKKDKDFLSNSYSSRSKIYLEIGDTISAINDLAKAIKIDPGNSRFYNDRANIYFYQGKYDLSNNDFREATRIDPGSVMGYMGIGRNENKRENWRDAIIQFDYALKLAPEYSSGYSFRADSYVGLKEWNNAVNDIIKALEIDGNEKAFYTMQHLPDEAISTMIAKLKIQCAKNPNNNYWPYCIGIILQNSNKYEEAISFYEQAHGIDANSIFLEKIAQCYRDMHWNYTALTYVDKALAMAPEDYDLIELKANILSDLGRYDESLTERTKYISKYPSYSFAYLARANDFMMAKRFKDAINDYETAIAILPILSELCSTNLKIADSNRLIGDKNNAQEYYNKALNALDDYIEKDLLDYAMIYSGLGNIQKTEDAISEYLQTDSTEVSKKFFGVARVYARIGKTSEAIDYLSKAIENGYDDWTNIYNSYDLDPIRDDDAYKNVINQRVTELIIVDDDLISSDKTQVVEVSFTKDGGVTKVKCYINELPLYFVFDTGAADVTISMVEANFMLKNEYINPNDVIGTSYYMDANGDISEGTVINLRKVNFGGLELDNVRASVVRNQQAPLLLGQSVLGRLGKIEIDNTEQKLIITQINN